MAGIALHLAARIMAVAGPDDILVSNTVKDLVIGSDIAFDNRGAHDLKGIKASGSPTPSFRHERSPDIATLMGGSAWRPQN